MKTVKDEVLVIQGSGGGSGKKQHTPVEEPNTLRAKVRGRMLDLVAYGPIKGLVNGLRSVYLDGTPIENSDGTLNFQGITVTTREGYPDQTYIPGFRSVQNTSEVNTEIKQATPIIRSMTNNDADAVAVTVQLASLFKQEENGDTVGTSVEVVIEVRKDGGGWNRALAYTFQGKTTSPYPKTFRIDLKQYGKGSFDIRVSRPSKESEDSKLADKMTWTLMTEIIDRRFSHPNMAMVGIEVDSELFGSQMPARVYHMDLSITKVPSNWDPYTRVYTGIWDGTFKDSWHDNPAWAYYDLATHPVIGADLDVVDKWELYRIAQYCDELVPNGYGGMEPRFTINTVFADQEDATAALNTLASIFRGMTYWGTNTVVAVADMPESPVLTVGPSSVKDGDFARTGTSIRERHSVAIVMWNDPNDMGKAVPEIYEDPDALAELGWRETRVTAVACNSRGQARRMAMWILDSERHETQTLTYTGTTEHAFLRPGNIIEVADPFEQGARMSGRLLDRSTNQVTLDKVPAEAVAQIGGQWWLSVMLPDMTMSRHKVSSFDGDVVHLLDPLLTLPVVGAIWGLYSAGLQLPYYRVVSNAEDSETGMFQVTATEYDPNKYSRVELGLILPERPISMIPNGPLPAPTNLEFKVYTYYAGTARQQGLLISFEPPNDVRIDSFVIDVKSPSDAGYRTVYNGPGTSFDMTNAEAGQWTVRVRSTASTGKLSQWVARTVQISQLLLPTPPDSVTVAVATFSITLTPISAYADALWEFWRSPTALTAQQIEANATQLPTGQYLVDANLKPDTQYYYYVRGVNQYGKSNWFGVQGKTLNDFDDILDAVTEDIKDGVLYEYFEEKIDTKAAQVAIDKATETVNEVLADVNQSVADMGNTLNQVAASAQEAVDTANQAKADLNNAVASVTGTLQGIMADTGTLNANMGLVQAQLEAAASAREYSSNNSYTAGQFISVGRSLYQAKIDVPAKADGTNAPPNGTYWRDAGSVMASADGLASRVSTAENSIGTINGTLSAQATAINGIQTTLNGKADASALTALTTRVTDAEGVNTSQGDAITSLTNNLAGKADASALTSLSTRVTTAENAITSQGNAITSLTNNLAGKADASALTALTSRVTAAEGTLTSQGNAITSLSNNLANKADASALTALTSRVDAAEGALTSQGSSITSLSNSLGSVGGENLIYNPSFETPSASGSYVNLLADGWGWRKTSAAVVTPSLVQSTLDPAGKAQRLDVSGLSAGSGTQYVDFVPAVTPVDVRPSIGEGAVSTVSIYARGTPGLMIQMYLQYKDSAGATLFTSGPTQMDLTGTWARINLVGAAAPAGTVRVDTLFRARSAVGSAVTAGYMELDRAQLELGDRMTGWKDNVKAVTAGAAASAAAISALTTRVTAAEGTLTSQGSAITSLTNNLANKADASALTSLTTRVAAAEGSLSSQGSMLTSLSNSLSDVGGENLLYNPSFDTVDPAKSWLADGWAAGVVGTGAVVTPSLVDSTLDPSGKAQRIDTTGLTTGTPETYAEIVPATARRTAAAEGQVNVFSVYVRGTPGMIAQLYIQPVNSAGTALSTTTGSYVTLTSAWQRISLVSSAFPANTVKTSVRVRLRSGSPTNGFMEIDRAQIEVGSVMSGWKDNGRVAGEVAQANAAATSALTTRVANAEGSLTSQGSSITALSNSLNAIGGSGANLIPAEYASFTATLPVIQKRSTTTVTAEAYSAAYQTHRLKVSDTDTAGNGYFCLYENNNTLNVRLKPSTKYIFSAWAQCGGADRVVRLRHRYVGADGVQVEAHLANVNLTTTWGRVSATFTTPAALVDRAEFLIFTTPNANSLDSWWDGIMVEEQIGNSTTPSSWVSGPAVNAVAAQANATSALNTRLTSAEGAITSQSSSITALSSGLSGVSSDNLIIDPTYAVGNNTNIGGITVLSRSAAEVTTVGCPSPRVLSWSVATSTGNTYMGMNAVLNAKSPESSLAHNMAVAEGETYDFELYVYSTVARQYGLWVQFYDTAGASINHTWAVQSGDGVRLSSTAGAWTKLTGSATVPAGVIRMAMCLRFSAGDATKAYICAPVCRKRDAQSNSQASALQSLDTRVTAAEGVNTSQATSITNLTTSVAGKADTSALTALTTRVTATESAITSQSSSITNLTASLNNIGGDNLLPNSSFENLASATTTVWWVAAATVAGIVSSIVDSPLAQSTKAQRLDHSAIPNNGYVELRGNNTIADRIKVRGGASYVLSTFARGTPGLQFRQYITWYNAAGASLGTITSLYTMTDQFDRYALTGVAPATAASALVYGARLVNNSGATTALWMEADNAQMQEGTVATAYVPSVEQGLAGAAAATQALDTRLTAAEGVNTSQGSAITSLTNSLAGKADASALSSLTTRVTAAEGSISSQGSAVTALQTSLGNIGGTGSNLNPSEYSVFGPNAPTIGAISSGLTVSTVAEGATLGGYALKLVSSSTTTTLACYLHASNTVAAVGSFPMSYSNKKYIISFYAKANVAGRQMRAWLRGLNASDVAVAPTSALFTLTTDWVRYSAVMDMTNATTFSGSRMVFAMQTNTSGVSGTEVYLDRIMVEQQIGSSTEPSAFDAGTSYTQAQAQASAINSLDTRVTSAEGVNTSQATSISSLTTRMGSAESSITTTANSLASTNGTLSSMWAMKINTAVGGKQYVAGMGVSMVTSGGITQSEILFQADRFALINSASGAITVPFFIENGVTYIQSAMIKQATIVNAIIGAELSSAAYTTWGGPVMSINFNVGQIVTRHPTSVNTYSVMNQNGMYVVVNGVLRVRMGVW